MSESVRDTRLTSRRAVGLVTRREIRTRLRSKAFLVTTLIMLVGAIAGVVVTKVVSGISGETVIGLTSPSASLGSPLRAAAESAGQDVRTRTVTDPAEGRRLIRDGKLDVLVVGRPDAFRVVVKNNIDKDLSATLTALKRQQVLDEQVRRAGGDPAQVNKAVATTKVTVQPLEPIDANQTQRLVLGLIAGGLVYISLLIYGSTVAQGVIEEKSSRIVELLLTAIQPWQLMAGKVLGIGTVGLLQMVTVTLVGSVTGVATGVIDLPPGLATGMVIWALVWYLIGFFSYALLFAAAGALVSRQEDAGSVTAPMTMLVIIPYVLGVSILPANPDNGIIEVLSMIPLCSPTLMPMRIGIGAPAWEVAVAIVANVVAIGLLVRLAGTIYGNAVLRVGSRVRLSDAFRPS